MNNPPHHRTVFPIPANPPVRSFESRDRGLSIRATPGLPALGDRAVRSGDQFEQVAAWIVEINAAGAIEVVDLARPLAAKICVMRDTAGSHAGESGVELRFADQEGVMPEYSGVRA